MAFPWKCLNVRENYACYSAAHEENHFSCNRSSGERGANGKPATKKLITFLFLSFDFHFAFVSRVVERAILLS